MNRNTLFKTCDDRLRYSGPEVSELTEILRHHSHPAWTRLRYLLSTHFQARPTDLVLVVYEPIQPYRDEALVMTTKEIVSVEFLYPDMNFGEARIEERLRENLSQTEIAALMDSLKLGK